MIRSTLFAFVLILVVSSAEAITPACTQVANSVLEHQRLGVTVAQGRAAPVRRQIFTQNYYTKLRQAFKRAPKGALNPNDAGELSMAKSQAHFGSDEISTLQIDEVMKAYKDQVGWALWSEMESVRRTPDQTLTFGGGRVRMTTKGEEILSIEVGGRAKRYLFKFGENCRLTKYEAYSINDIDTLQGIGKGLATNCDPATAALDMNANIGSDKGLVCRVVLGSRQAGNAGQKTPTTPRSR